MAGYAAALRVLTRYAVIDGRDMTAEAIRPRVKGETTFVDGLIAFAVDTANQCLVPQGIPKPTGTSSPARSAFTSRCSTWKHGAQRLSTTTRIRKGIQGARFQAAAGQPESERARGSRAPSSSATEMSEGSELHQSVLRAVLYAVMELVKNMDGNEVLAHLMLNMPDYYGDMTQRELAVELADYLPTGSKACAPKRPAPRASCASW